VFTEFYAERHSLLIRKYCINQKIGSETNFFASVLAELVVEASHSSHLKKHKQQVQSSGIDQ